MSISNEAVEQIIRTSLPDAQIRVSGDGYKYEADIISSAFEGLMTVKRHQLVYAALNAAITSGQLHAITLRTKTPAEASA
ncbi:MAG TPA: BolA/IbaG family iron-sulfur metabolism protein [Candidatus Thiothrix moscowensis]|uniref:BolA family protein n=1 Tax=unclassified Thiothrix TaxID=2636184 RepID=UPI001A302518|nr:MULTISPECIES: BolA/IbaG family iron-sulfur metabolism protein [unclassified Thiothrix]MBJ6610343.1 BolA/IbaG family iron-sulfur metabolism protein [Candidatus Thiothrix moscowensis]HRJ51246.1 BolA/IbaG family iron-sulfur metabolism protein [Candidatus Thiothrix moscowensis]HRJ91699.1 BolA/IbaG family iron-sulfur metabolism protein [Candidatus Thiothrix moscowensis]